MKKNIALVFIGFTSMLVLTSCGTSSRLKQTLVDG